MQQKYSWNLKVINFFDVLFFFQRLINLKDSILENKTAYILTYIVYVMGIKFKLYVHQKPFVLSHICNIKQIYTIVHSFFNFT